MKVYKVGGCVRDELMGLEPKDIDFVVVGSTPEKMEALGFKQVGVGFPVFLHPKDKCEYALARTEKKTGIGYGGFDVEIEHVTLEEDLFRRDLTINAMAITEDGIVIDPYHGQDDLNNKILRHVSVHFKEDPVRILRIARFSARYNFDIAPETIAMMKDMVDNGEFNHLTGERVWQEFEKVLPEQYLQRFFNVLSDIGALNKVPGFQQIEQMGFFDYIREKYPNNVFDMSLLHVFSQMESSELKKWKMPADLQQKISQFAFWKDNQQFYSNMPVEEKLIFIQQNKALHSLVRAEEILNTTVAYQNWSNSLNVDTQLEFNHLSKDINVLKSLDYPSIVKEALFNKEKPDKIVRQAQMQLLETKKLKRKI